VADAVLELMRMTTYAKPGAHFRGCLKYLKSGFVSSAQGGSIVVSRR
jgi:hypothetical protein